MIFLKEPLYSLDLHNVLLFVCVSLSHAKCLYVPVSSCCNDRQAGLRSVHCGYKPCAKGPLSDPFYLQFRRCFTGKTCLVIEYIENK